jgi:hypothetical protein
MQIATTEIELNNLLEATQAKAVPHISLTIDFAKGD